MKALKNYLKNNKKTHLIFDFDATIFELILPWEKHFDAIEKELSALDQDLWSNYEQEITGDVVTQHKYIEQYGKKARDIFDKNSIWFEQHHLQNVRVNEPLVEFIQNDNDYVKYVWSSNSRPSIERVLKEHNLMDSFQAVVTREMVENIKPYTYGFKHIDDGKTAKEQYLFIGDSINDEGAASALGVDFFKVAF